MTPRRLLAAPFLTGVLALSVVPALSFLAAAPASAADATVTVTSHGFSPRVVEVALDGTVTWSFVAGGPGTSTSDEGFWDSGTERTGDLYDHDFISAGRFAYHSRTQPQQHGAVEVPVRETGSALHGYALRWSTVPGGRNLHFEVQVRPAHGDWHELRGRTTGDGATFDPAQAGRYQVRARTDRGRGPSGQSGWSPATTVVIS